MARARTLALCGLDRGEEAAIRGFFDGAVRACGIPWALAQESEADALLIDVDSMYGQMSWLRAQGGKRPIIALTSAARADADFMLPRPATQDSLSGVLAMLAEKVAAGAEPTPTPTRNQSSIPTVEIARPAEPVKSPAPAPAPSAPAAAAPPAPVAPSVPGAAAEPAPEPAPPRELQLVDYLREGLLPGAVRLRGATPPLLIDPIGKTFLGGSSLKPLLPLAARPAIASEDWEAVTPHEFERLSSELGSPQPLARLLWLAGLGAGGGQLRPELRAATRFKLGKYPTAEREFPKHIRIATAMLKQLSTPEELAAASGVERSDVCDYINACHALDLVETDLATTAAAEPVDSGKGGLLGRLRGKR